MNRNIAIVGAGLVGSLMAIYLVKRGYKVSVFEKRSDFRKEGPFGGRSINLALSNRGLWALDEVGLADPLRKNAIPMPGRMIHDLDGKTNFIPYGKDGQFINSISRGGLNEVLVNEAEKLGVQFFFNSRISSVDIENTTINFYKPAVAPLTVKPAIIIGADGAYSTVRGSFQISDRFDYSQDYIEHGYKELTIPAAGQGNFQLEKNALHIWPRESFMLIALPNPNATFTCTLFLPFEGQSSFANLQSDEDVLQFFICNFPDTVNCMPSLLQDFKNNPTSSLVTIRCFPWVKNNTFLIGDAAHSIVPFFGQGMNAGFEDCRILNKLLDNHQDNWETTLQEFQNLRKPDTNAIAKLALDNFIEMRDLVADKEFILRKKIETRLHELYPDRWIPLYSMVTFHENIRYSNAWEVGQKQKRIMDEVLKQPGIELNWTQLDFAEIAGRLT